MRKLSELKVVPIPISHCQIVYEITTERHSSRKHTETDKKRGYSWYKHFQTHTQRDYFPQHNSVRPSTTVQRQQRQIREWTTCVIQYKVSPRGRRDDMPPAADGSSTVAKIAVDLRPSADESAVRTSLVARQLRHGTDRRTDRGIA